MSDWRECLTREEQTAAEMQKGANSVVYKILQAEFDPDHLLTVGMKISPELRQARDAYIAEARRGRGEPSET